MKASKLCADDRLCAAIKRIRIKFVWIKSVIFDVVRLTQTKLLTASDQPINTAHTPDIIDIDTFTPEKYQQNL